jgi:ABC-type transport system involved in multi-copper enzyme maturation permease subunit
VRALLAIEIEKILRRRLNQIVFAIVLVLLVVVYVLLWLGIDALSGTSTGDPGAVEDIRSTLYLQGTVPFAILMLYTFGFVGGVVVIGSNIGSEYTWNTIRTLTAAEPRRWRILAAKLIALWAVVVVGLLIGLIVALATSAIITLAAGKFDLGFVDAAYVRESALSFLRILVGTAPYFSLAALLGVVGRSPTAGIALALGVAFLEGIISGLMQLAGGWVAHIPLYTLDANADSLALVDGGYLSDLYAQSGFSEAIQQPSVEHAVAVLLFWAFALIGMTFWSLSRQDLPYEG